MARRKARLRAELGAAESVTDAIYAAGYGASSRGYAAMNALGMAPSAYRNGAGGETIRYASASSSLGPVVVAATGRGVCMVEFGAPDALAAELAQRFPKASIARADADMAALIETVVAMIDAPATAPELPLDIRGTAFQERVWRALTAVPPGQMVSYAELARRIGQPGAARAVAHACAKNGIAVAVPCHRVVRGSGELAGYKWGVERKRALLAREGAGITDTHGHDPEGSAG
jgi:AraC family transcriptional regulator of adaptative response/methylated-DNA-[protein]-cysteine methyltransferase